MRRISLVLLLSVACSSTNPYRPAVTLDQLSGISFAATTRAPFTVEVQVTNRHTQPLTVHHMRIEGGLSQQYRVTPADESVLEVIQPGQTFKIRLVMTAYSQQGFIQDPEPLNLRAFVSYNVGEQQFRDLYLFRTMIQ